MEQHVFWRVGAMCGLVAAFFAAAGAVSDQAFFAGVAACLALVSTAAVIYGQVRSQRAEVAQLARADQIAALETLVAREREPVVERSLEEVDIRHPVAVAPASSAGTGADDLADRPELSEIDELGAGDVLADFAAAARAASLTDPATGLFNEQFFLVTLEARISAARRHLRPVAVVLLDAAEGVRDETGPRPVDPLVLATGLRATLREADTASRLPGNQFALILEDTPENGAVWTIERVRRALVVDHAGITLWAGVACYPAHAFDATEILDRAKQALEAAREWRQDRIEVATAD